MRRFRRKRRPGTWYQPNAWKDCDSNNDVVNVVINAPGDDPCSAVIATPILKGNAPFQGSANPSGRASGTPLGELQRFTFQRIVGRLYASVRSQSEETFSAGWDFRFYFGFMVWKTDNEGVPEDPLPDPSLAEDMDEPWLFRDMWRVTGWGLLQESQLIDFPAGPSFNYIDVRTKRRMRNEEDMYLFWKVGLAPLLSSGSIPTFAYNAIVHYQLRPLARMWR